MFGNGTLPYTRAMFGEYIKCHGRRKCCSLPHIIAVPGNSRNSGPYRRSDPAEWLQEALAAMCLTVGNQQKWDTFVKERSGGNGSVVGLPEQVVVAFAAG